MATALFRRALLGSVTAKVLQMPRLPRLDSGPRNPSPRIALTPSRATFSAPLDLKPESSHTLEYALETGRRSRRFGRTGPHRAGKAEIGPLQTESRLHELLIDTARSSKLGFKRSRKEAGASECRGWFSAGGSVAEIGPQRRHA